MNFLEVILYIILAPVPFAIALIITSMVVINYNQTKKNNPGALKNYFYSLLKLLGASVLFIILLLFMMELENFSSGVSFFSKWYVYFIFILSYIPLIFILLIFCIIEIIVRKIASNKLKKRDENAIWKYFLTMLLIFLFLTFIAIIFITNGQLNGVLLEGDFSSLWLLFHRVYNLCIALIIVCFAKLLIKIYYSTQLKKGKDLMYTNFQNWNNLFKNQYVLILIVLVATYNLPLYIFKIIIALVK